MWSMYCKPQQLSTHTHTYTCTVPTGLYILYTPASVFFACGLRRTQVYLHDSSLKTELSKGHGETQKKKKKKFKYLLQLLMCWNAATKDDRKRRKISEICRSRYCVQSSVPLLRQRSAFIDFCTSETVKHFLQSKVLSTFFMVINVWAEVFFDFDFRHFHFSGGNTKSCEVLLIEFEGIFPPIPAVVIIPVISLW